MTKLETGAAAFAVLALSMPVALAQDDGASPYDAAREALPTSAELDSYEAAFAASLAGGFTTAEPTNAAMEPFQALLPEELSLTWENAYTDPNGAFVAEGITLGVEGTPLAIRIDELRGWGFDSDALAARLGGARLGEDLLIADRLELSGIALVGIAEMAAMEGNDEVVVNEMALSLGRFVVEDFYLGAWVMNPIELDADDWVQDLVSFAQMYVAVERTFVASFAGFQDLEFSFDVLAPAGDEEVLVPQAMSLSIGSYAVTDQVGGDIGLGMMTDFLFDFEGTDDETGMPVQMKWTLERYTIEGMMLDKVFGYLARGEMPPTAETDLMSLGVWVSENEAAELWGKPYAVHPFSATVAKDWHWFIPERITSWSEGTTADVAGLMETINEMIGQYGGDTGEEQIPAEIFALVEEVGLGSITLDGGLDFGWSPDSGSTGLAMDVTIANLFDFDLGFDGTVVDYETGVASFEPDEFGDIDPGPAWVEATTLGSASVSLRDLGGLTTVANIIIGVSKLYPEMDEMGFSEVSAQELRAAAGGLVVAGAFSVQSEIPEVGRYSLAVSNWLNQGGTLTFSLSPETPLPLAELAARFEADDFDTPSEAIRYVGLKVTHTPAEVPTE